MHRNLSQHNLERDNIRNISKSPSFRTIYINQQTNKRQVQTHFHSPYKNGRPNKDYCNPSFISSHLFYPKQSINANQKVIVRSNIIPTAGDLRKQELYKQRLIKQTQFFDRSKSKSKNYYKRQRQFVIPAGLDKVSRFNEPEKILKNQLSTLHYYRQKIQSQLSKSKKTQNNESYKDLPPYLQKQHKNLHSREQSDLNIKKQLTKYINHNEDLKNLKRQINKINTQKQNSRFTTLIEQQHKANQQLQKQTKKKSQLLGNVLRQQIKTNRFLRERQYNY